MGRVGKPPVTKGELRQAIAETGGNIAKVAERFNKVRQTIYTWIDHYGLRGDVDRYRRIMFSMAEDNILGAVEAGDVDASKFVVTHFPGGQRWSSKHEVSLGTIQLPDDVVSLAARLGIQPADVAAEFEALIREHAAAMAVVGDDGE